MEADNSFDAAISAYTHFGVMETRYLRCLVLRNSEATHVLLLGSCATAGLPSSAEWALVCHCWLAQECRVGYATRP